MNCKKTDIAYLKKSPLDRELIGRVVEVESAFGETIYGFAWYCRSKSALPVVTGGMKQLVVIPDDWLRPISGVPLDDETPIETNVPEAVALAFGIHAPALS